MEITVINSTFILGPEKEMYWPEKKTLIISDLHLGKIKHFVNNGIQVPELANTNNYWRLTGVIENYDVERVLFLGDLFHSVYNKEWETFKDYIANYASINWVLILGNHDILHPDHYHEANLKVVQSILEEGINFTHEPSQEDVGYNICGHLHPAIRLRGTARQSLRLPCFHFGEEMGVLPAFGEFTGALTIKPVKGDRVFVIADKKVIAVS